MVEWKTIDDISNSVFAGGTPSTKHKNYYDGDIPWIRSGEIDFNTITKAERNITQEGYNNSSAKLIRKGSVVMAMTGATVAKSAIVEYETSANQSVCAIETDESIANYKYVYFYLAKEYFKIKSSAQGALTSLNLAMIKQIEIPIPSLEEQTRIVGILDTFTATIDNLKEQIAQRRKQYEYYRDQLLDLEGKEGVEMKALGEICDIFDGTHQTPHYTESGIRFVSVENIKNLRASTKYISAQDYEVNYRVKPQRNDVLMTRIGDVGSCAIINFDEPIAYYVSLSLLRPNHDCVISNYMKYLLESQTGRREIRKRTLLTAVPLKINLGDIGKLVLPVPSLSDQRRIVSILDTFESSIQNLESQLKEREKQYEYYRNKLLTFE